MSKLSNINSVAKYESKLLMRSWFYRIFLILAILVLCILNFAFLVVPENTQYWIMRALPSNIPYYNLLLLNTGQAVIAVFLSSEFLKSDKKLDTSEVFYVHPLSNAEYVIGKIWGNMNVFFRLNLIIILLVVLFNIISGLPIDWLAYLSYFLLICVPTLIYIFGLSIGLMLILKNQAITFVILLGYIALTLFYIADKFYYLFDYMVYNLPLVKSSFVGFTNWSTIVNHRLIYLLIGLGFICISIFLFRRLPNTRYGRYRWLAMAFCFIVAGLTAGYRHVNAILQAVDIRAKYTEINNMYVNTPQMVIDKYDINVAQHPETISVTAMMTGIAQEPSSVFTFCLNPALTVREIKENGADLTFSRDHQIILIDFGRLLEKGDTTTWEVIYDGRVDENFCYLDIPAELLQENYTVESAFNVDKKYSFQTENYVLFTPETYWYPRPGVAFSNETPDWQKAYFSNYRLTVKTMNGLQALSQGTRITPQEKKPTLISNEYDSNDSATMPSGRSMGGGGMVFMGGGPRGGGMGNVFGGGGPGPVMVTRGPGPGGGSGNRGQGGGGGGRPQRQDGQGASGGGGGNRNQDGQGGAARPQRQDGQGQQSGQGDSGQGGNVRPQRQDGQGGGNFRQPDQGSQEGGDSRRRIRANGDSIVRGRERGAFSAQSGQEGGEYRVRFRDGGDSTRRFRDGGDSTRRFRDGGDSTRRRFREEGAFSAQDHAAQGENRMQDRPQEGEEGQRRVRQGRNGGDSLFSVIDGDDFMENLAVADEEELSIDSIFVFETDFPTPGISLIIGNYKQKCVEVDHAIYNLWHLKGNDFFSTSFDSIMDTIPSQIRIRRQTFESTYALNYSFKRFSLIETPVQFYSYVRSWTQAQEKIQPEMVFIPEKGCTLPNMDVKRQILSQKAWSKRQGVEISDYEAALRVLNGFLMTFQRAEDRPDFSMERGAVNLKTKPNPYFLFPQLYNFRYNIYSSEWTIANRLIELYLQDKADNFMMRQTNGISNNEKANLLIQKRPFKDLLTDPEQRDLLDNVISLKANVLFAPAELNVGYMEFRDSLRAYLNANKFANVRFEDLLDEMSRVAGENLRTSIDTWDAPTKLPVYIVGAPEITYIINRDVEVYVVKLQITNDSDNDGIINVETVFGGRNDVYDPRAKRKIALAAHETKQLVTVWEEAPRAINVNTLISANLPNQINMPANNIARERNIPIDTEGDFVITNVSYTAPGEVIVDNEDAGLFELSQPDIVGLLPKWLDQVGDNSFPYSGVQNWRPPLQWTLTTNDKYYGTHIRSAYVIKSGNGSQWATWKVPVPTKGLYDLYYYVFTPDEIRRSQNNRGGGGGRNAPAGNMEYHLKVKYDGGEDNAYINLRRAGEGWYNVGTYNFMDDTIKVVLSNDVPNVRMVTADAVKIVKRETSGERENQELSRIEN